MLGAHPRRRLVLAVTLLAALTGSITAESVRQQQAGIPRFELPASGLRLDRATRSGAFLDVVGRRSAFFGYEHQGLEAWVYPMKLVDDLQLSFTLEGYPLEIPANQILKHITATPEATILTCAHAAFTARVVLFAPVDERALVVLLDVDSALPIRISASFRPKLRLMWPAGLQTGNIGWNAGHRVYQLTEETGKFAGVIGSPAAHEGSLMPYQEEPRDVPVRFDIDQGAIDLRRAFVPIVIAGSTAGLSDAQATYDRVIADIPGLFEKNVVHYRQLLDETVDVETPDARVNEFYRWAKVGVDKGVATNPFLGTGLLAGFRTSGESERPGFAWYFGRDAMWTSLALDVSGPLDTARTALAFLRKFQRDDGKMPHEISQSASLIPWFTAFPYAWASADATPLYILGHAEYWRASGDTTFIREAWPSLLKAWHFSKATDTDHNGLIENTGVGHGWVEGGALYPAHEEIYLQGVWIEAERGLSDLADALGDKATATAAREDADKTRQAVERTYWQDAEHAYAYATKRPRTTRVEAEPGPNREQRQQALDAISGSTMYDERTVLTAVPLWWHELQPDRADMEIDSIGGGALATDWGQRLLSNKSALYDPLSYHYGSVWPLFTGWASVGAYAYGRPQVGYQALMANMFLGDANALGYVTELLSGDFQAAFGRSSHHQVWSEAMVITPLLRGLFGIRTTRDATGAPTLTIAPQLPADWTRFSLRHLRAGEGTVDVSFERASSQWTYAVSRSGTASPARLILGVSVPLDGSVLEARADGRPAAVSDDKVEGDVHRFSVQVELRSSRTEVRFTVREGSDVYRDIDRAPDGSRNRGLRILRSRADDRGLSLRLEGLAGRREQIRLRSLRRLGTPPEGVRLIAGEGDPTIEISFDGPAGEYVRRDVVLPLSAAAARR
jgi:glycogen debranching enzyme